MQMFGRMEAISRVNTITEMPMCPRFQHQGCYAFGASSVTRQRLRTTTTLSAVYRGHSHGIFLPGRNGVVSDAQIFGRIAELRI